MAGPSDVTLFIDPFSYHFLEDRLFDAAVGAFNGDDILGPWIHLRDWFGQRGIEVTTADRLLNGECRSDINVYVSFGIQQNCRNLAGRSDVVMSAFFAFEGPIVEPSLYRDLSWIKDCVRRVYSFTDSESLAPFLTEPLELRHFCLPSPVDGVADELWRSDDRGFLTMINGNKLPRVYLDELYTERMRAVAFFGRTDEIDLYGIGWDVPPYRMGKTWMPYTLQRAHRKTQAISQRIKPEPLLQACRRRWRGTVDSKCLTLSKYTFAICFENQILNGWITEKIFDCLSAGTVPIYLGPPDVDEWIPAECYVDMRDFAGYDELRDYLRGLGPTEIEGFREAGREFLASERFYPFSKQAFVDRCRDLIAEDTGVVVD
jgi:hypothetical protein